MFVHLKERERDKNLPSADLVHKHPQQPVQNKAQRPEPNLWTTGVVITAASQGGPLQQAGTDSRAKTWTLTKDVVLPATA